MKKFATIFTLFHLSLSAQVHDFIGIYKGTVSTESVTISVRFDIKKDSSYKIEMNYNFKEYCTGKDTGSMSFTGFWKADEDWLFLDPNDLGISIFFQYETWGKHDKKIMARNVKKDRLPLKVMFEKGKCARINFRINSDCFKDVRIYNPIQKVNCVAE